MTGVGWGLGNSGPRRLELRLWPVVLDLEVDLDMALLDKGLLEGFDVVDGVLVALDMGSFEGATLERVGGFKEVGVEGTVGVGEEACVRAFFAFLLRNFSSSSEDVASESFAL